VDGGFPTPRPLLYLADVLATETIIVAEGERCADAVRSLNLVATTAAHGAQSPHLTDWSPMRGKRVVILVDYDDDGEKYAATAARTPLARKR
jgi:DNA primase